MIGFDGMPIRAAQFQLLFRTLVQSFLLALVMTAPCATQPRRTQQNLNGS